MAGHQEERWHLKICVPREMMGFLLFFFHRSDYLLRTRNGSLYQKLIYWQILLHLGRWLFCRLHNREALAFLWKRYNLSLRIRAPHAHQCIIINYEYISTYPVTIVQQFPTTSAHKKKQPRNMTATHIQHVTGAMEHCNFFRVCLVLRRRLAAW